MCGLWGLEGFVWDFLSFFETCAETLIYLTTDLTGGKGKWVGGGGG